MTDYASAASALGVPESILRRSVEARAKASGVGVDDLLAAWAGGTAPPPASAQPTQSTPAAAPTPSPSADIEKPAPVSVPTAPTAAPPAPQVTGPIAPPVLVGVNQGTQGVMAGSIGILVLSILLAFIVPSLPQPGTGVRSSNHPFSSEALLGQDLYLEHGCGSCHTQLIRAVVADAKLGPVTLSDSNQVFGYRRIGPDLAAIGGRTEDTAALAGLLAGSGDHPAAPGLSESDLAHLLTYLREST